MSWIIAGGIDPGYEGAFAFIDSRANERRVHIHPMPSLESKVKGKFKREHAESAIADILSVYHEAMKQGAEIHIGIELVHSMPHQGVKSTFSFGTGYGILRGIMAAFQLPYTLITPQEWKGKLLKGKGGKTKEDSIKRAFELWPGLKTFIKPNRNGNYNADDGGKAEAYLIAQYIWDEILKGDQRHDSGILELDLTPWAK